MFLVRAHLAGVIPLPPGSEVVHSLGLTRTVASWLRRLVTPQLVAAFAIAATHRDVDPSHLPIESVSTPGTTITVGAKKLPIPTTAGPSSKFSDRLRFSEGETRAAECIIAEIGVDMSRFPTAGHLASWAGMCPGSNITGGKRHSGKTTKGDVWLSDMLVQCAWSAARSRDTYLSAQFWRLARRIGKKKAAVAVGHSILVICWHLLTNDCDYTDLGGDYFARRGDANRHQDRLVRQLQDLGYAVTLRKVA